jgi:ureidoglycolate dehydrogenase (NAD+)
LAGSVFSGKTGARVMATEPGARATATAPGARATATTITAADLHATIAAIFETSAVPSPVAGEIADMLVWAELHGVGSHGVLRVPRYLEMIESGEMDPRAVPVLSQPAGAVFRLDARHAPGPVAMRQATDASVDIAARQGTCFGLVTTTTHTGAIGMWAERIAGQGMAALISATGPANMAYHGAAVGSLSTSPIAIGIPGPDGPIVLDMATSVFAMGRLPALRQANKPLPPDWALAADGTPTTDPRRAVIPLPVGGAKGSGLSLMFECLTSLLGAAPILVGQIDGTDLAHRQNAFVITIDIAAFRPLEDFKEDMAVLSRVIHALPRRAGFDEILLPGEGSRRVAAARGRDGIPTVGRAWDAFFGLAANLGVRSNG